MEKVAPMARAVGKLHNNFTTEMGRRVSNREDTDSLCSSFVKKQNITNWIINACHGNSDSQENHIPDAGERINVEWFAYHHARVTLAFVCVFLKKYGLSDNPGKKFPNTKLDNDYLALLHYADGLASDEAAVDMADMSRWLFGNTKPPGQVVPRLATVRLELDASPHVFFVEVTQDVDRLHDPAQRCRSPGRAVGGRAPCHRCTTP
jgi:hypothetical protein